VSGEGLGHLLSRTGLAVDVFIVVGAVITVAEVIRPDPKHWVPLFAISAFGTLFLGPLLFKFFGFSLPGFRIWLALFFGLILAAASFAFVNWSRRRKKAN